MKLFHLVTTGDSLNLLEGQAAFMRSHGVEVHVISSPGPELSGFGQFQQVATHEIKMMRRISPFRDVVSMVNLLKLFLRERPDIIHTHTPKASLLGITAGWLARVPCRIFHIHGLPHGTATGLSRMLLKCATQVPCFLATGVVCVSHSVAAMATADGICEAQKLTVFGQGSINGVDGIGGFCPAKHDRPQRRQLLGLGEGYLVIGFVGRLARDKGISELLSAWLTIREEFPNAYLAIAGSADERDPAPSEAIARLRADDRVRLLGWRKNTIDVYASLDIIVLPTYREGLPTVILEAAAMLVPAVASRCVGCVDAVVDGVTGLLVPPGDPVALADAIRTYLGNPDLRHQHGVNARARVLTDFRPEDVWEATLRTYQAAVSPPLPSPISARPGVNR